MRYLTFLLSLMVAFASFGINCADSVRVYFQAGQYQFDPTLDDNRAVMDGFDEKVRAAGDKLERIVVRGYASPDSLFRVNERVTRNRCTTIADYIAAHAGVSKSLIERHPEGNAWSALREMVFASSDAPSRLKVLDVLDNTPIWIFDSKGEIIGGRKKQLMEIDGGRPYRWMYNNLFPRLVNAVGVTLITTCESDDEVASADAHESDIANDVDENAKPAPDGLSDEVQPEGKVGLEPTYAVVKTDSRFVLKTNLLDYAVLMPNIEAEWMFTDKWSAALEMQGAWYARNTPHKVYRLATIIPEVRYWAIERSRWKGMYVGLFGGVGQYDLSNGKQGHEGEGAMAGMSVGYMWPIGKYLSLEAGIGVGYLRIRDKKYLPADGHFLYQFTRNINYVGPLRLKLSLVWRFQCKKTIGKK